MSNVAIEKMHEITIDVVTRVFDKDQNIVSKIVKSAFGEEISSGSIRVGGTSALVSVLRAYELVRDNVKDNLNNLEIGVDGSPFQVS